MRGKWENAISGKQRDNVRQEIQVVSAMIQRQATNARLMEQKDNRFLPHQIRRPRLTEREKTSKDSGNRDESSSENRAESRADMENEMTRHVFVGPSCVSKLQV